MIPWDEFDEWFEEWSKDPTIVLLVETYKDRIIRGDLAALDEAADFAAASGFLRSLPEVEA